MNKELVVQPGAKKMSKSLPECMHRQKPIVNTLLRANNKTVYLFICPTCDFMIQSENLNAWIKNTDGRETTLDWSVLDNAKSGTWVGVEKENVFACRLCRKEPYPLHMKMKCVCETRDCPLYEVVFLKDEWRILMQPGHTEEAIRLAWSVVEGSQPHTVSADSLIVNLTHLKGETGERMYTEEELRAACTKASKMTADLILDPTNPYGEKAFQIILQSLQTGEAE